jgi:hypothetical protein
MHLSDKSQVYPQHTFMVNMITIVRQWHLQKQESLHMKLQIAEEYGHLMDKMDGTLAPP